MDVRTIKMVWEELDTLFESFFSEVLGKTVKCHADFADQTYWGVRFVEYEMPVAEIEEFAMQSRLIMRSGRGHSLMRTEMMSATILG